MFNRFGVVSSPNGLSSWSSELSTKLSVHWGNSGEDGRLLLEEAAAKSVGTKVEQLKQKSARSGCEEKAALIFYHVPLAE